VEGKDCPIWKNYVNSSMGGDEDLVEYIQRVCGMVLCGEVLDKVVFFANGGKDSGKTTFVTTLQKILGEQYSTQIDYSDFMEDRWGNTHRTQPELESIEGKRLSISSEGEQNQKLSIARMKQLTGMGYVAVNPKYKSKYQFIPQATFIFDTNYFPEVDGTDDTIFERIKILPFEITVPKERQDRQLRNKLLSETEGILWWMIEGCKKWREYGLGKEPEKVRIAVKKQREENDPIGQWLTDDCKGEKGNEKTTSTCQDRYNAWAKEAGQPEIKNAKTFKRRMDKPQRVLDGLPIERLSRLTNQNSGGYLNIEFKIGTERPQGEKVDESELSEIHEREQGKFKFEGQSEDEEDNLDENFI